ncbi:hypothetical protein BD410DRAFT_114728 [Rickenella mellea]|uniref:Uncharacterized protein n=1 Tax=Rickenella mellea TaxID=50990 RepID=A0A4Y7QAJ0_9AGAM|nr:hypothetical protein BD410DRAFT_114728 [Rickenella mellea]
MYPRILASGCLRARIVRGIRHKGLRYEPAIHSKSRVNLRVGVNCRQVHGQALVALEPTASFFRRVDATISKIPLQTEFTAYWVPLVQKTQPKLSSGDFTASKPHVVVYGTGRSGQSASADLVTALLGDPLSSDDVQGAMRDRWKVDSRKPYFYEFGANFSRSERTFHITSPHLRSANITEIPPTSPSKDYHCLIYNADVPIFVVDPLVTQLSELQAIIPRHPNTIVVVNAVSSEQVARHVASEIEQITDGYAVRVLFIDVERAARGLHFIRADKPSTAAIHNFQDAYEGSRLGSLQGVLENILKSDGVSIRIRTAQAIGRQAVTAYKSSQETYVTRYIEDVGFLVKEMRGEIEDEEEKITKAVFGGDDLLVSGAFEKAGKDVKVTMDALKWWKLPNTVDDITRTVTNAVENSSLRDLHKHLILQTGCLIATQGAFLERTNYRILSLPIIFESDILRNALAQVSDSPTYVLSTTTLLSPLQSRQAQLAYPTNRLHLAAQRALLSTVFASFGSAAGGYWAWMGTYLDGPTASGAAILATMITLRWAVGRWEIAKVRWWQDWERISQGLERDLKRTVGEASRQQVFAVPERACIELDALNEQRTKEADDVRRDLDGLLSEAKQLEKQGGL